MAQIIVRAGESDVLSALVGILSLRNWESVDDPTGSSFARSCPVFHVQDGEFTTLYFGYEAVIEQTWPDPINRETAKEVSRILSTRVIQVDDEGMKSLWVEYGDYQSGELLCADGGDPAPISIVETWIRDSLGPAAARSLSPDKLMTFSRSLFVRKTIDLWEPLDPNALFAKEYFSEVVSQVNAKKAVTISHFGRFGMDSRNVRKRGSVSSPGETERVNFIRFMPGPYLRIKGTDPVLVPRGDPIWDPTIAALNKDDVDVRPCPGILAFKSFIPERIGANPITGKTVTVPACVSVQVLIDPDVFPVRAPLDQ